MYFEQLFTIKMEFTNITKLAEYWGVSRTMIYEKINS